MKSKINRKMYKQPFPPHSSNPLSVPHLIKFKFQISKDNISCFIGKSKVSKRVCRKNSQSSAKSQKPASKQKVSVAKKNAILKIDNQIRQKESSPDIIRESSNTILSKIQQKGIMCTWNQANQHNQNVEQVNQNADNATIWSAFQTTYQKSFASTNDFPHYHTVQMWNQPEQNYGNTITISFVVQPQYIEQDWRTTLMIRNIPNKYTVNELADQINSDHENTYDFLYLPCDPKNQCNVGYGFINFINTVHLKTFYYKYNRYVWQKYKSQKICALTYARLQGLNQLIQHFQNSKVLNQKQKKYRPIIKMDKIQRMVIEQQSR